jgi:hypothetical protein
MVDSPLSGLMNVTSNDSAITSTASHELSNSRLIQGITRAQARLIKQIVIPLNILSIIGAFMVIFCIVYLRWRHRRLADRVSLRLTLGIAVGDALLSTFQALGTLHETNDDWWCAMCGWGYVETSLFSVFLTMFVAFNLHAVFVHSAHPKPSWEFWYFVVAIVGSFCASLPPWLLGIFGYDSAEHTCWFRGVGTRNVLIWQWASLFGWLALAVMYCVVAVTAVAWKLIRGQTLAREDDEENCRRCHRRRFDEKRQKHHSLLRHQLSNYMREKEQSEQVQLPRCSQDNLVKGRASMSNISSRSTVTGMLENTCRRVAIEVPDSNNGENVIISISQSTYKVRKT